MDRGGRGGQGRAQGPDARAASGLLVPGARDLLGLASLWHTRGGAARSALAAASAAASPAGPCSPKGLAASEPASVITARRPQELPCARKPPLGGGRLRDAGPGAVLARTTLLTQGPRRSASQRATPSPAPCDPPAALWLPGPPRPAHGAEGVRVLEPPGEDEEVAILFCGNCVCACAYLFG